MKRSARAALSRSLAPVLLLGAVALLPAPAGAALAPDTTPPVLTFEPPARVSASVSASATDDSNTVPQYEWTLDDVVQAETDAVLSTARVPEGRHVISVLARDQSGNASPPVTATVVVDHTVHSTVSPVNGYVKQAPELTFSSPDTDGVTFTCSTDSADAVPCTSPWTPDLVTEGLHTVTVLAVDDVLNDTAATRSFIIDATGPVVSLTGGPDEGGILDTPSTSITPAVVEANPDAFVCALDGDVRHCTPGEPVVLAGLTDGAHAFAVTATDLAGNTATVTRNFTRQRLATVTGAADVSSGWSRPVVLTATGLPDGATGSVTFRSGNVTLCGAGVTAGVATCTTTVVTAVGSHPVEAAYAGDDTFAPSTGHLVWRVVRLTPTVRLSGPSSATQGTRPLFRASVAVPAAHGVTVTGPVTWIVDGRVFCHSRLSGGTATCRAPRDLRRGTHRVTALYAATAHVARASAARTLRVFGADPGH